jgi:hypothetical protein
MPESVAEESPQSTDARYLFCTLIPRTIAGFGTIPHGTRTLDAEV